MALSLELTVNGVRHTVDAHDAAERTLLSVLRDDLDLTGAKYGCGEAQCGACLVLVNGQRTPSCITPAGSVGGQAVTTIEGLEQNGRLHVVQQAFLDGDAMQCGYCTPGMIIATIDLLNHNPDPADAQIAAALETNICRCGAHGRIVTAVRRAAQMMKEGAA